MMYGSLILGHESETKYIGKNCKSFATAPNTCSIIYLSAAKEQKNQEIVTR